jgi:hypothetical protein
MAKYDIGYITERYNAILKKLAAGTATKSVYRESRELLKGAQGKGPEDHKHDTL